MLMPRVIEVDKGLRWLGLRHRRAENIGAKKRAGHGTALCRGEVALLIDVVRSSHPTYEFLGQSIAISRQGHLETQDLLAHKVHVPIRTTYRFRIFLKYSCKLS